MIIFNIQWATTRRQVSHTYKLYLTLLFFLSCTCYSQQIISFGGTIIVHKNGNGLYIGADSKGGANTTNNPICKIHIAGKTVIAGTGVLELKSLDIAEIANKTINDSLSYMQIMKAFSRETNKILSGLLGNFDMANQRTVPLLTVVFVKSTTIPDTLLHIVHSRPHGETLPTRFSNRRQT